MTAGSISHNLHNTLTFIVLLLLQSFLYTSCRTPEYSKKTAYQFTSVNGIPDYSNLSYWAAHPWKKDPSDSIPRPLQNKEPKDSLVDVFFIHPTTLTAAKDQRMNAPIDDALINSRTDYSTILYQASAFNENTRVFAPRYRQAHIRAFYSTGIENDSAFEIAYTDVRTAFEYYLTHYNGNRPIIIAAHSQGTKHAARLLKEYFNDKPLANRLICAYLLGMPVPVDYFTHIPVCTSPAATGCFVSWRSFKTGYTEPDFVAKETFRAAVVNPLSWTTDETHIPRSQNTGGILKNFNKVKKKVTDARIHRNVLWMAKPRFFGNLFLTTKNYHIGDINLFYNNIRQNLQVRISTFWKK